MIIGTMAPVCWWDMNAATPRFPLRSLASWCQCSKHEEDSGPTIAMIASAEAFQRPTFCSFECAYAFMLLHQYDDAQMTCLMTAFRQNVKEEPSRRDRLQLLTPAIEPFCLALPYGGPITDIDAYRQHATGDTRVNVPFAHTAIEKEEVETLLLEQQQERQALLNKVTK